MIACFKLTVGPQTKFGRIFQHVGIHLPKYWNSKHLIIIRKSVYEFLSSKPGYGSGKLGEVN